MLCLRKTRVGKFRNVIFNQLSIYSIPIDVDVNFGFFCSELFVFEDFFKFEETSGSRSLGRYQSKPLNSKLSNEMPRMIKS